MNYMIATTEDGKPVWEGNAALFPNLGENVMFPPHKMTYEVMASIVIIAHPKFGDYISLTVKGCKL